MSRLAFAHPPPKVGIPPPPFSVDKILVLFGLPLGAAVYPEDSKDFAYRIGVFNNLEVRFCESHP